jgi:FkbM family methyltransferase
MSSAIRRLRDRPDFRAHPLRALWRRLWWRLRWRARRRPWVLPWHDGLRIALPKEGPAALIYYQGFSEPDTAALARAILKPGMVFVDVGAHIGEYTLLAAQRVGKEGEVHAFEPNPRVFPVLVENIRLNGLEQVVARPWAVAASEGQVDLRLEAEAALSAIVSEDASAASASPVERVRAVTLDGYLAGRRADLVKIDVEGAEMLVLRGAGGVLARPAPDAPVLVFECARHNYARFGFAGLDVLRLLEGHGYAVWRFDARRGLTPQSDEVPAGVTLNLVATKDPARLASLMGMGAH